MVMKMLTAIRIGFSVALFLLLPAFLTLNTVKVQAEPYLPKIPGKFVLLHEHRLYYHCEGEGSHSVLIDGGIGDASANWLPIQKALSEELRVCVYDRAGYGMSDQGPGPRTSRQIVDELYQLITDAHIPGPYILVGQSFGGFTAQLFAKTYPRETAGVVLIESSHPQQAERLAELDLYDAEHREIITGRNNSLPEDASLLRKKWHMLNSRRKAVFTQMEELKYFQQSAKEVIEAGPLPDMPLAVLSREKRLLPTLENTHSMEDVWQDLQTELAHLNAQGGQIIVPGSGHNIHLDAPDAVVAAIQRIYQTIIK